MSALINNNTQKLRNVDFHEYKTFIDALSVEHF